MKLRIDSIQRHRNGISGAPFHAVTFRHHEQGPMVAVVFEQPHHVAVLQLDKLAAGDIAFGSNSWRGDQFEPFLRSAINLREEMEGFVPFDAYEISPCLRFEEPDRPGQFYFEPCEPHEAHVWTLYGHIPGEGVEAIGDFATREQAEEVYARITGQPYQPPRNQKGEQS